MEVEKMWPIDLLRYKVWQGSQQNNTWPARRRRRRHHHHNNCHDFVLPLKPVNVIKSVYRRRWFPVTTPVQFRASFLLDWQSFFRDMFFPVSRKMIPLFSIIFHSLRPLYKRWFLIRWFLLISEQRLWPVNHRHAPCVANLIVESVKVNPPIVLLHWWYLTVEYECTITFYQ